MSENAIQFTAAEFVEYWEGKVKDDQLAVDWLALQVQHKEGLDQLGEVAMTLAKKHGISSPQVKSFRSAINEAYKKLNKGKDGDDKLQQLSFTFEKKDGDPVGVMFAPPGLGGRQARPVETMKRQFKRWYDKGYCETEMRDALDQFIAENIAPF